METVYRMYDEQGALLYIGRSLRWWTRVGNHREKDWWGEVTRIEMEHVEDSRTAEREAIHAEHPRHNVVHNRHEPGLDGRPRASTPDLLASLTRHKDPVIDWRHSPIDYAWGIEVGHVSCLACDWSFEGSDVKEVYEQGREHEVLHIEDTTSERRTWPSRIWAGIPA